MPDTAIPLRDIEVAVLSVLLADPRTIIPVSALLTARDFSDTVCAKVYGILLNLAHEQKVPNAYAVAAVTSDVTLDTLLAWQAGANPKLVSEVIALADIIQKEAAYRRVQDLTQTVAQRAANRPPDLTSFVYQSMRDLGAAVEGRSDRPNDLVTIGKEVDELLADESGLVGIPTGFGWLTDRIGGFRPGHIVVIAARYKGRKSSCARNMILASARAHRQTAVYLLEDGRADMFLDLWAMLATQHLYDNLDYDTFLREATLDGMHLRTALRSKAQHAALTNAREELEGLTPYLHICDGRDKINYLPDFANRLRRDRFLYQTEVIFLDHLQLMMIPGKSAIFDRVEGTMAEVQAFAKGEGVTAVVLSQQSEAGIKEGDDAYSPNTKGGGAPPAAADHVLTLAYDSERAPDLLKLKLKLSRRAQPGSKYYEINPSTGLCLREADALRRPRLAEPPRAEADDDSE